MASCSTIYTLSDITKCSICLQTWTDPRSLPGCDHTFCLQCLKDYIDKTGENSIHDTRCPLCRQKYSIPNGGLDALSRNFMHQQLLLAAAAEPSLVHKGHGEISVCCDLCSKDPATKYCVECEQNICKSCTFIHLRARATMNHKMVALEEKKSQQLIRRGRSSYCEQHKEERVKLYCKCCKKLLCTICHATKHHGHDCDGIDDAAQRFVNQLEKCHVDVNDSIVKVEERLCALAKNRSEFLQVLSDEETKLKEKKEEMIKLIKAEHELLWNELNHIKKMRLKEMNMREEEIKTELLALQGFKKTSKDLINKGTACEICHSTNGFLDQAKGLVKSQTASTTTCSTDRIDVSFTPAMIPDVSGYTVHLVGLVRTSDIGHPQFISQKAITLDQVCTKLEAQANHREAEITSLSAQIKIKTTELTSINIQVKDRNALIADLKRQTKDKDTEITGLRTQVQHRYAEIASLKTQVKEKSDTVTSLEKQMEKVEEKHNTLKKENQSTIWVLLLSQSSIVHVIPGNGSIPGVAVIDSELFVARHSTTHIEVYDANNFTTTSRLLKITDEILRSPRLAACSHHNCLYVRHYTSTESVIYCVALSTELVSTWTVKGNCTGLSLANNYNLLMTIFSARRVQEYTRSGRFKREVIFHDSIDRPLHCVQLSNGNFVVCHAGLTQHRVCIVDNTGNILNSYGELKGSGVHQLKDPCYLSLDKYDHVFVADKGNNRVQLLSHSLTLLGTVQTLGHQLNQPIVVHFDEINGHLFIEGDSGSLLVVGCKDNKSANSARLQQT